MNEYTEDGQVRRTKAPSRIPLINCLVYTGYKSPLRCDSATLNDLHTPSAFKSTREGQNQRTDTFPLKTSVSSQTYAPFIPVRPPPPRIEFIFSSEIFLVDNTAGGNNTSTSYTPPLFVQGAKIDGWVVVGGGSYGKMSCNNPPQHFQESAIVELPAGQNRRRARVKSDL
jgi:hypothetical protein